MTDRPHSSHRPKRSFRLLPRKLGENLLFYPCLLLASLAGIAITGLSLYRGHQEKQEEARQDLRHANWEERLIPTQADLIDLLVKDVSPTRSFALFENGTVVVIEEPSENPRENAVNTLTNLAASDTVFAVNKVGLDFVIRYNGPVFTRISGKTAYSEKKQISKNWTQYLTTTEKEKIAENSEAREFPAQVGLVARSFLLRDSREQKMTKILKAKSK